MTAALGISHGGGLRKDLRESPRFSLGCAPVLLGRKSDVGVRVVRRNLDVPFFLQVQVVDAEEQYASQGPVLERVPQQFFYALDTV